MITTTRTGLLMLACCLALTGCPDEPEPDPCEPSCEGTECGEDGCGGTCGSCDAPFTCSWWTCVCPADTLACGETCCEGDAVCREGECCTTNCEGRTCGDDGCGGTCGPGCGFGEVCDPSGVCSSAWVRVDGGAFVMGSSADEHGRFDNESAHAVTLTHDYEIYATEISRAEFASLLGYEPMSMGDCGPSCPATFVSWHEAAAFCNALSDLEEVSGCYDCVGEGTDVRCEPDSAHATPYDCPGYRLPTEAEWERAARGDTETATYNGDLFDGILVCEQPNRVMDSIAWTCGNAAGGEHPAGELDPNALGLFDMLGNVAEWVHDACPMLHFECDDYGGGAATDPFGEESGLYHVVRGGSWSSEAQEARAAARTGGESDHQTAVWGFRPARTAP